MPIGIIALSRPERQSCLVLTECVGVYSARYVTRCIEYKFVLRMS